MDRKEFYIRRLRRNLTTEQRIVACMRALREVQATKEASRNGVREESLSMNDWGDLTEEMRRQIAEDARQYLEAVKAYRAAVLDNPSTTRQRPLLRQQEDGGHPNQYVNLTKIAELPINTGF